MYESFFGFVKRPFLAVSTLDRYFPASSIEQTFQTASRAIQRGEGPIAIFGGIGLGKTMCCLRIAESFRRNFEVVMLASSQLITRRALLQSLLFELRMPYREMSEGELRLTLMNRLQPSTENPSDGLVLIVDEAQTLSTKLLEELRLLTNVVRNGVPRVRLVLCGNLRLEESLGNPIMESLNQRMAARCYLTPLSAQETGLYVKHKIELSGVESSSIITRDALDAIYRGSDGIPRLIDQLADQALMLAAADRERPVSAAMVGRAWCMLQQLPNPWSEPESIAKTTVKTVEAVVAASNVLQPLTTANATPEANALLPAYDAVAEIATTPEMPMVAISPTRTNSIPPSDSAIEFGQLDDELVVRDEPSSHSFLRSFTDASTPVSIKSLSAPEPMAGRAIDQTAAEKNYLNAFAGDFDEEFSIPVQSSGSYQSYSGAAYGNLNYDLSNFGTHPGETSQDQQTEIPEANDFLIVATPTERVSIGTQAIPFDPNPSDVGYEMVSNISPEQAANLERQIEDEMRELVSGLNLSAMTFDPHATIDAFPAIDTFPGQPGFSYETSMSVPTERTATEIPRLESVRPDTNRTEQQRMAHLAHSDVLSFSSMNSDVPSTDTFANDSSPAAHGSSMGDDRDLLVIEDELESVRSGAQQAATASSRAVLHPYAKLFSKLRS
jgi:type II secretory pathway predicted ATPase ExeA